MLNFVGSSKKRKSDYAAKGPFDPVMCGIIEVLMTTNLI